MGAITKYIKTKGKGNECRTTLAQTSPFSHRPYGWWVEEQKESKPCVLKELSGVIGVIVISDEL